MLRVTRAELYDLVWTTPVRRLAPQQFGLSDVAFAKMCRRMNVPLPGRGYWAQVAAGAKLKKKPLPKDPKADEQFIMRERDEKRPVPAPRPAPPPIRVPRDLRSVHEAVRRLGEALGDAEPDRFERLIVGAPGQPVLAVTIATHRRALLLLAGLAEELTARGHKVTTAGDTPETMTFLVTVGAETVALALVECLDKKPHVMTTAEKARAKTGWLWRIPKYDSFASGRLQVVVEGYGGQRAWSDTPTRKLEDQLGRVLLAVEERAAAKQAARLEEEDRRRQEVEQRRREEERRRQRERDEERARYRRSLQKDLRRMAARWSEADTIRRFLEEAEVVLGEPRSPDVQAWFAWARGFVDGFDPLKRRESVAKKIEPPLEAVDAPSPSSSR